MPAPNSGDTILNFFTKYPYLAGTAASAFTSAQSYFFFLQYRYLFQQQLDHRLGLRLSSVPAAEVWARIGVASASAQHASVSMATTSPERGASEQLPNRPLFFSTLSRIERQRGVNSRLPPRRRAEAVISDGVEQSRRGVFVERMAQLCLGYREEVCPGLSSSFTSNTATGLSVNGATHRADSL